MDGAGVRGADRRLPRRAAHEGRTGRGDRVGAAPRDAPARDAGSRRRAPSSTPAAPAATCAHTFNISTAAALIAAGAGLAGGEARQPGDVRVRSAAPTCWKRSASQSTSMPRTWPPASDEVGIGFLFAQAFHPAMRHVADVRRQLGVRTLFNLLGPLTNPAGAERQLLGVFARQWVEPLAQALEPAGQPARARSCTARTGSTSCRSPARVTWRSCGRRRAHLFVQPRIWSASRRAASRISPAATRRPTPPSSARFSPAEPTAAQRDIAAAERRGSVVCGRRGRVDRRRRGRGATGRGQRRRRNVGWTP